ncbi:MAG TPA: hypothetical protein VHQ90_02135 [Thermoanaerobaculia bacterium]|nr:hypothetical protein [Thermoanaerobaculia bacterium]
MFFAEGWHWRWGSWGQVARWVEAWAGALAARGASGDAETRVGFAYVPSPQGVALDLAIQAAGLVSVPVALPAPPAAGSQPGEAEDLPAEASRRASAMARDCRTWVSFGGTGREGGEGGGGGEKRRHLRELPGLVEISLPAAETRGPAVAAAGSEAFAPGVTALPLEAGGALIDDAAGPRLLWQSDLLSLAGHVAGEVATPPAGEVAAGRDIVVCCRPLAEPGARAVLSWAAVAGAAVVLEPDPANLVATAAWARPTVFHGSAAELASLRRRIERKAGARWSLPRRRLAGLPWGRLRAVLLDDPEALGGGEGDFWRRAGARIGTGVETL